MSATTKQQADEALDGQLEIPVETAIRFHGNPHVTFVDATWWIPGSPTSPPTTAREDFERGPRISGSMYLDIDDVVAKEGSRMMPPGSIWSQYLTHHGIVSNTDTHVIIYSQSPMCSMIHRGYVQFLSMGHDLSKLHVLAGALPEWQEVGGPVDTETVTVPRVDDLSSEETTYPAPESAKKVVDVKRMREIVAASADYHILDARSADRFLGAGGGTTATGGHMPGAKNVFYRKLLQDEKPILLKPVEELKEVLGFVDDNGNSETLKPIVATCGSGVTACTIKVALLAIGCDPERISLYDGSWGEWSQNPAENPIVKGEE